MNTPKTPKLLTLKILFLFTFLSFHLYAQQYTLNNTGSDLKVYGTSNIHDWHLDAEEQSGFIYLDAGDNLSIEKLKIIIVAETLKSGKKGMDKNTFKALNTEKYSSVTYLLTEIKTISKLSDTNYKVESRGDLTIAGVTKKISLSFTLNQSGTDVRITGEKKLKMTDYKIEPPTALLGTISTGDEITIKFNTLFKK